MLNTPPLCDRFRGNYIALRQVAQKKRETASPRKQRPAHLGQEFEYRPCSPLRQGENGERSALLSCIFYHIYFALSIAFLKFFHAIFFPLSATRDFYFIFALFALAVRHSYDLPLTLMCICHKYFRQKPIFFYCVSFFTNFSTKNRLIWIFTN